jgi:hypothetical protein
LEKELKDIEYEDVEGVEVFGEGRGGEGQEQGEEAGRFELNDEEGLNTNEDLK